MKRIMGMLRIIKESPFMLILGLVLCLSVLDYNSAAQGADWPQWRGPNRDGVCSETGLLKNWPADGPKLLWEATGFGPGYSSMAIVDGGLVRIGDYIYGGHDHNKGKPTCIEAKTGKIMWQKDQPGGGSAAVLYADGNLYFRYDDDTLALIEADPQNYNLISKFKLPKRPGMSGPGWSHLVIADGKLYARHSDVLMVYDIKAK